MQLTMFIKPGPYSVSQCLCQHPVLPQSAKSHLLGWARTGEALMPGLLLAAYPRLTVIVTSAVHGSITTKCKKLEGLQIGQLVSFKKEHIVEVHEDSGSESDY